MNKQFQSNSKQRSSVKEEKYIKLYELGKGSFGNAILVKRASNKEYAVIKSMLLEGLREDEKREAFMEAKILKSLNHPNIVKFIEVFRTSKPKSYLNIVMEFAEAGDMYTRIRNQIKEGYFQESVILDWFTQICLAIRYIHKKRILHRDLKSKNVFLTKNGLIKLGDFGIAKCLNFTLDIAKTMVGTPYYLSPEMVRNEPYSFKSDIWSLGVLLYEMTCLRMPFDAKSLPMLSVLIIKGEYQPIPNMYSKDLFLLIKSLLNTNPSKRPSIDEILKSPLIKSRISHFLTEMELNSDLINSLIVNYNKEPKRNPTQSIPLSTEQSTKKIEIKKAPSIEKTNSLKISADKKSDNSLENSYKSNSIKDKHFEAQIEKSPNININQVEITKGLSKKFSLPTEKQDSTKLTKKNSNALDNTEEIRDSKINNKDKSSYKLNSNSLANSLGSKNSNQKNPFIVIRKSSDKQDQDQIQSTPKHQIVKDNQPGSLKDFIKNNIKFNKVKFSRKHDYIENNKPEHKNKPIVMKKPSEERRFIEAINDSEEEDNKKEIDEFKNTVKMLKQMKDIKEGQEISSEVSSNNTSMNENTDKEELNNEYVNFVDEPNCTKNTDFYASTDVNKEYENLNAMESEYQNYIGTRLYKVIFELIYENVIYHLNIDP